MKIDTALYSNEKRHRQKWYFIVDTILSMSHPDTLVGAPGLYGRYREVAAWPLGPHSRPTFSGHRADSTVDNLVSKLIWTPPPG